MTRTVLVLGCGKRKLAYPAPACDLYTGTLFRQARRYAEATGQSWVILSAAHGIVAPSHELAPYDLRLGGLVDQRQARTWAKWCASTLRREFDCQHAVLLAGVSYTGPLGLVLREQGVSVAMPLEGLSTGARMHWLKTERERLLRRADCAEGRAA